MAEIKLYSAGVVVIRNEASKWLFLILRCYRNWDFPKGGLNNGESFIDAAIRETEEETSIKDLNFNWGDTYCDTTIYANRKVARYFIAQTEQSLIALPINPALGKAEHDEYKWASIEEARNILPPRLQPILEWAFERINK